MTSHVIYDHKAEYWYTKRLRSQGNDLTQLRGYRHSPENVQYCLDTAGLRSYKCKAGKYTILAWHGVHKHRNIANNMVSLPLFTNTGTPSRRLEFCIVADTVIRALGRIQWLAHHKKRVITLSILSGSSLNLLPLMPQQSGDSCSTSHALVLDPVRLFTERTNKTRVRPGYEQHKQAQLFYTHLKSE